MIWTRTRKGKKMPLDAEPSSGGRFALAEADGSSEPLADFLGSKPYDGERYTSHFETCPDAAKHSRGGRTET